MAMRNDTIVRLYDQQPHSSDSLGGTPELGVMCREYAKATGNYLSEGEMLTAVIGQRKSGHLAPKAGREKKDPPKPSWPALEGGVFHITLPITLDKVEMRGLVSEFEAVKGVMPVTRQELFDFLQEYPDRYSLLRTWEQDEIEHRKLVIARTKQLFPEFSS